MGHIAGDDRDQMLLLPEVVDDYVSLRIPMLSGRAFRDEAGRDSDLKSATIPR